VARFQSRSRFSSNRWHRAAALRAREVGYDIVYSYAGYRMSLAMQFLMRRYNDRSDEYGGSLENRSRFLSELIEETKEAAGDRCAVATPAPQVSAWSEYTLEQEHI
jgi:2,4-dienoyl-CoA reductase-like NADH-dependent reductase (Old Yellow Enzyme family)